ncbi:MAG TPA: hypothetical protein V6C88_20185 [Chroococcidiopsis sp.]
MNTLTVPLVCFGAGSLILIYTSLAHGRFLFQPIPEGFNRRDVLFYFISYLLIATALMLGLIGYFSHASIEILHPLRIGLGVAGLIFLFYQFLEVTAR